MVDPVAEWVDMGHSETESESTELTIYISMADSVKFRWSLELFFGWLCKLLFIPRIILIPSTAYYSGNYLRTIGSGLAVKESQGFLVRVQADHGYSFWEKRYTMYHCCSPMPVGTHRRLLKLPFASVLSNKSTFHFFGSLHEPLLLLSGEGEWTHGKATRQSCRPTDCKQLLSLLHFLTLKSLHN